jgi:peptidoglycan DL-endopeptidase LytF
LNLITQIRRTAGIVTLALLVLAGIMIATPTHSFAAPAVQAGANAVIANTNGDNIRIRVGAGTENAQIAEAHEGETVSVLEGPAKDTNGRDWFKVSAPGGTGWIIGLFLQGVSVPGQAARLTGSEASAPALTGFARVGNSGGDSVRLHTDAYRDASVITLFPEGTSVAIKSEPVTGPENVIWYQVSAQGLTGWMMAQYLVQADAPASAPAQPAATQAPTAQQASQTSQSSANANANTSSTGSTAVNIAMKYLGYRYVFGGATPSGFDCSGFVYYVYNRQMGMAVGRDVYAQLNSGVRVTRSNLQVGDILIFANTYKPGPSHAAIYIGGGRFIHAENESTGVTISSLSTSYWGSRYYSAVRPTR